MTDPDERLAQIERTLHEHTRLLRRIAMATDPLQAAFDDLKAKEAEAAAADVAGAANLKSLREKLEAMKPGTALTPGEIITLTADLGSHTAELTAATGEPAKAGAAAGETGAEGEPGEQPVAGTEGASGQAQE